jgi:hypothetical protein
MKIKLLAFFFLCHLTILASDSKFPLYKIGVKIDKPKNYFLLSTDEVKELKKEILSITDVCEYSKVSLDRVVENPNYQILLNDDNFNETIAFIKHSNMPVNKEFSKSLKEELASQCYSFKNISIEYVSESEGKSSIGNYISFLYNYHIFFNYVYI